MENGAGFQVWEKAVVLRIQLCEVSGIQKYPMSRVEDQHQAHLWWPVVERDSPTQERKGK